MIAGSRGIVGLMFLISLKLEPSFYYCLIGYFHRMEIKVCVCVFTAP